MVNGDPPISLVLEGWRMAGGESPRSHIPDQKKTKHTGIRGVLVTNMVFIRLSFLQWSSLSCFSESCGKCILC